MTATPVTVHHLSQPSRSKGWARYRLTLAGAPVLRSTTGNDWLGLGSGSQLLKPKTSEAVAPGDRLLLEVQVSLNEGQGHNHRTTLYRSSVELIAGDGSSTIAFRPGSQGSELRVEGAVAVAEEQYGRVRLQAE